VFLCVYTGKALRDRGINGTVAGRDKKKKEKERRTEKDRVCV